MRFTRNGVITALLVIAALFVGTAIADLLPSQESVLAAPYEHRAVIGQPVELRTGTITVTGVRSAKQVAALGQVASTEGIWAVVDFTWKPTTQPYFPNHEAALIQAVDGRKFSGFSPITNGCLPTQAGVTFACSFAFEMDPAALAGAEAVFPAAGSPPGADDVAVVNLGIDEASAQRLAASTEKVTLSPVMVKEP